MDYRSLPWEVIVGQTVVVFALILLYQWLARGAVTPVVLVAATAGFFTVAVAVEWYRLEE